MKTVSRLADVFSVQSWVAQTAWPWLKRAYFLQGFLCAFLAFQVIGHGLMWLLTVSSSLTPSGVDAFAALRFAWLTIGVLMGLVAGLMRNDVVTRWNSYTVMDANLRARFEDDPNVMRYDTVAPFRIKLWLRATAPFPAYPSQIDGWPVELVIWRGASSTE